MKEKVKTNITLTSSKVMAYLIFIASVFLTIYMEDMTAFSIGIPVASALILGKQGQRVLLKKYETEGQSA